MIEKRDIHITGWPGLFWPCLWLFLMWGTLDSIKLELRAIREGMGFESKTTKLIDITPDKIEEGQ